jgi:hypothetical protein
MEKTRVGRLYGAEERVLERVVTYLVSAAELGYDYTNMALFRDNVMHKGTNTSSVE